MSKRKTILIVSVISVIVLIVGSLAAFSDRANFSATMTASKLEVSLLNDDSGSGSLLEKEVLSPGGIRGLGYKTKNTGNTAADVKEIITLTITDKQNSPVALSGSASTQSEFDVYRLSDLELVSNQGYVPKTATAPLSVKAISGNKITYTIEQYSLNAGVEHTNDYVLLFKDGSAKSLSNANIKLKITVLAKQSANTNNSDWVIVDESETNI